MTINEIKQVFEKPYNKHQVQFYREQYKVVFKKNPNPCNCNDQKIYQDVKNYYDNLKITTEDNDKAE